MTLKQRQFGEADRAKARAQDSGKVERYRKGHVPLSLPLPEEEEEQRPSRTQPRNKFTARILERTPASAPAHRPKWVKEVDVVAAAPLEEEDALRAQADARRRRLKRREENEEELFEAVSIPLDQENVVEVHPESSGFVRDVSAQLEERESIEDFDLEDVDEEDQEDEDPRVFSVSRPVFVPRNKRDTIEEREMIEARVFAEEEARRRRELERTKDSKAQLRNLLQKEQDFLAQAQLIDSDVELPDDEDLADDEEFEHWKIRELKRLQDIFRARAEAELEKAEKLRRSKMTEEELEEENRKLGLKESLRPKGKMEFMQKYFHPGAFYQDDSFIEEALRKRDATIATGLDKVDKTILPSVMQVKDFGKRGRTKCRFHAVDVLLMCSRHAFG